MFGLSERVREVVCEELPVIRRELVAVLCERAKLDADLRIFFKSDMTSSFASRP